MELRTGGRGGGWRSRRGRSPAGPPGAVVPIGSPSVPTEVTTVTPVAKCPIASRNSAADSSGTGAVSVGMGDLQSAEPVTAPPGSRRQNPKSSITTEIIDFRSRGQAPGTQNHLHGARGAAAEPQTAHLAKVT